MNTDNELDALRARVADAEARVAGLEADLIAAAGECLVPVPEPGSDMARVVSANALLRARVGELEREVGRLTTLRPMSEAPRDGTEILICEAQGGAALGVSRPLAPDRQCWSMGACRIFVSPLEIPELCIARVRRPTRLAAPPHPHPGGPRMSDKLPETHAELREWLVSNEACSPGLQWFDERLDIATLESLYPEIPRGDWLIWLLGKSGAPKRALVRCAHVAQVHALWFADEATRPVHERCIRAVEAWLHDPSEDALRECRAAADAAYAAYAAADASDAAVAAVSAYAAAYAAYAAAYAASAAGAAAARAADAAADAAESQAIADAIRGFYPTLQDAMEDREE